MKNIRESIEIVEKYVLDTPLHNFSRDHADKAGYQVDAFHGTGGDFDVFRLVKTGNGSGSREGPLGIWFTDNSEAASEFAEFSGRGLSSNVLPVKLSLKNPLIVSNYDEIRDIVDKFTKFERPGYILQGRNIRMMRDQVDYEAARKYLWNQGYDGIVLENTLVDSPDGKTKINQYVVLKPSQVRSTQAKFDPSRQDQDGLMEDASVEDIHVDFDGVSQIEEAVKHIIQLLVDKGFKIHHGRTRAAFIKGSKVIKVPLNFEGDSANYIERKQFLKNIKRDSTIPMATCRLFIFNEIRLLMMEYVEHEGRSTNSPWWTDFVDCGQVGRNKKGKLVAYDL